MAVRLLHFSDVHLPPRQLGWQFRDFFGKSLTGWINIRLLGRARRFKLARPILVKLREHLNASRPDAVLFSGDATHLGLAAEFQHMPEILDLTRDTPATVPFLAVPGNHDYYTPQAVRHKRFEQHFADWQTGVRIGDDAYPFARKIHDLWVIALNSARPNPLPIDASGQIGPAQLERLRQLNERLGPGRRILLTHYPLRTLNGQPEHRLRRLRDHQQAQDVAQEIGVSLWLHGHIHTPFYLPASQELPFPTIGNGSTTMNNRWSFHEYTIDGSSLHATRYRYVPETGQFQEVLQFDLTLSP